MESPITPQQITEQVLASFDAAPDPRRRELMKAFVSHLHAFVTEVELTEEEWAQTIGALTATGHLTDDKRQEFILWSDTLGVSMLVDSIANAVPSGATESTVLGPFYVADSPLRESGANMAEQEAGVPAWVTGRVLDLEGRPLAGAELDVWQNGDNRLYAVQDPDAPDDHLRGRYRTDDEGRFAFQAVRPVPYTIPDDGPVGAMLAGQRTPSLATGAHPCRHPCPRPPQRDHAHLRCRQRASRRRHRVRRQALAHPRVSRAAGRRPGAPGGRGRAVGVAGA